MTIPLGLIGITGEKYAGKTTAANYLIDHYGYGGTAITDPMIEMAKPLLRRMGITEESELDDRLQPWGKRKEEILPGFDHLTGRKVLQAIGKDLRDALSAPSDNPPEGNTHGTDSRLFYDLWLFDNQNVDLLVNQSVRYPFEGEIITSEEGETWRIVNPDAPASSDTHQSERQDWPAERTIVAPHSKGVEYLYSQIDEIMAAHGIPKIS
ncbi:MAG: hypothetical protein CL472_04190 [Acidobacteria bacterium]|nr:hypothetical protein [Acidobacteriota bacterium]